MSFSATTTARTMLIACVLASHLTSAHAANNPANEKLDATGGIASVGAQSFVTRSDINNVSGAAISLYADPSTNVQQSVTVSLWDSTLLSSGCDALAGTGCTPLATASATGGAGWLELFWNPVQVEPNAMYYLVLQTHSAASGSSLIFAGGGGPYAAGDALEYGLLGPSGPSAWKYMSGGAAVHGQVHQGLNGDFTFTTYSDPNFAVSNVPEPETYAMLLAGLGVLGFVGKRPRAA